MGLFDRFKKKKPVMKRGFYAANTGRLFADFITSSRSADSEIRGALRVIRDRCRESARNHPYSRRYIQILTSNVVGSNGVHFQSKKRNPDGTLDAPGNRIVEEAWRDWCRFGNCTVDGKLSFQAAQRLFIETWARDGEVLIRLVKNMRDNRHAFAIQFYEADYLDEEYNTKLTNGREVRMGVELDEMKRPAAYYLFADHPHHSDGFGTDYTKRKHIRVPADEMIHAYIQERPGQTRGVPPMSNVLPRLKMLDGYEEAELVAARVGASAMGFITSPGGDGYMGDDLDNGTPIMSAEPGTFQQLPAGMDVKSFDPDHPTTAFSDFEKAILRGISSGLGVSYVSLSNNLEGVSYSSIRQGVMEERDHFKMLQAFMVEQFIEPVFRAWLDSAMMAGTVQIPAYRYDEFAAATRFIPRGWQWVDPQKEIAANVNALNNGIVTLQDIHAHYGRDTEEVFEQVQRERDLATRYGISMNFEPFGDVAKADMPGEPDADL